MRTSLLRLVAELDERSPMEWILFDTRLQLRFGRVDEAVLRVARLAKSSNVVVEHRGRKRLLAVPFKYGIVVIRGFALDRDTFTTLLKTVLESVDPG